MRSIMKFSACVLLTVMLFHVSCQKELSCENCISNKPPIANAGIDQITILPKDSVTLDGSASADPDGNITSYKWIRISGPVSSNIVKADSSKTLVKPLVMGVYKFELTVKDNGGLSAKDTVQIIVNDPAVNQPPVANTGSDQIITLPTDSALLNGNLSFDPDGTIISWQWSKISGPSSFTISNSQSAQTKVDHLVQGVYQFELKVTDNGGLSAKDTVQIAVYDPAINHPPIACAGVDQVIILPINTVDLDGSCSIDPDNNITFYAWTKISGPSSFNIANANAIQMQVTNLVQGLYQFELKVTDAGNLFSKDTVQVTVNTPAAVYTCGDTNRTHVSAQLIPIGILSQTRDGITVASAANKILFAGGNYSSSGLSRVDIYDINTQTWSTAELSVGRYDMAAVAVGNKIFFGGGEIGDGTSPVKAVDIYDAALNTWSASSLSAPGNQIAAAAVGNKVFFAGGDQGFNGTPGINRARQVDILDLNTNTWSAALLSEDKRGGVTAVTAKNKIYFAGGATNGGVILSNEIDIYDNATNSWTQSFLSETKISYAAISVNDKIYWAGGLTGVYQNAHISCAVEIKDLISGNHSIQQLSAPAKYDNYGGQNAVVKNGEIVFLGSHQPPTNRFDIYDIATNTWSIGVLPQNIEGASIISVNNIIYVAGGYVNGVLSNQVWRLDF